MSTAAERESGDRAAFLGRLRTRLATPAPPNAAHPVPPALDAVPVARSRLLDDDLVGSFVRNARAVAAAVHEVDADAVPAALVADVVARHGIRVAVLTAEPEAQGVGQLLEQAGVATGALSPERARTADVGVTGCVAALATTGTVVVSAPVAGGRSASLLPPVHLCVVPASRIVASTAEVLRPLGASAPPSNLVLITGPSRSGDIEQIMTLGVHGPLAVELVVLRLA